MFGIDATSLMPCVNDVAEVFCLPEPSLLEQVLANNKYRQNLINEQFNPIKFRKEYPIL